MKIALLCVVILIYFVGIGVGLTTMQRAAVMHHAAHYEVNENGESTFTWNK